MMPPLSPVPPMMATAKEMISQSSPGLGRGRAELGRPQDRGQGGEGAGQDVGPDDHPVRGDAGQPGRGGVAARGQHPPAEDRVPVHIADERQEGDHEEEDVGNAEQALLPDEAERLGDLVGRAAGDARAQAHEDEHHRQGDDEGVDLEPGDEHPVERSRRGRRRRGPGATASQAGSPQVSRPRPRTMVVMLPIAPTARLIWPTTRTERLGQGDQDVEGHLPGDDEHGVAAEEALRQEGQDGEEDRRGDDQARASGR